MMQVVKVDEAQYHNCVISVLHRLVLKNDSIQIIVREWDLLSFASENTKYEYIDDTYNEVRNKYHPELILLDTYTDSSCGFLLLLMDGDSNILLLISDKFLLQLVVIQGHLIQDSKLYERLRNLMVQD